MDDQDWHVLAWQSGDDGCDRITVAPEKDFSEGLFTLKPGEWSEFPCATNSRLFRRTAASSTAFFAAS